MDLTAQVTISLQIGWSRCFQGSEGTTKDRCARVQASIHMCVDCLYSAHKDETPPQKSRFDSFSKVLQEVLTPHFYILGAQKHLLLREWTQRIVGLGWEMCLLMQSFRSRFSAAVDRTQTCGSDSVPVTSYLQDQMEGRLELALQLTLATYFAEVSSTHMKILTKLYPIVFLAPMFIMHTFVFHDSQENKKLAERCFALIHYLDISEIHIDMKSIAKSR